jgi:ribosome-associated heat shock protein Hsp15
MADDACRVDIWLWRARFCKTRALAARLVESGRVRVIRGGAEARLEKASRAVRPGDQLVFAVGGRLAAIRIAALGERRGPAAEARMLYVRLDDGPSPPEDGHFGIGEPAEPADSSPRH